MRTHCHRWLLIDDLMIAVEDCMVAYVANQSMRNTEPVTYDIRPYGFVFHSGSLDLVAFALENTASCGTTRSTASRESTSRTSAFPARLQPAAAPVTVIRRLPR